MDNYPVAVHMPFGLRREDKVNILRISLENHLLELDIKFSAFSAAALSENYAKYLTLVPDVFVETSGQIDINGLRNLIMRVPRLIFLNDLLQNDLSILINAEVIELMCWIIICIPNLFEESADDFMTNIMEGRAIEIMPIAVLKVMNDRSDILASLSSNNGIIPKIGYYKIKFSEIIKSLVHGISVVDDEPLLLNKKLQPELYAYEKIWKYSEHFRQLKCIAVCAIIPDVSNSEEVNTAISTYIRIYDEEYLLLNYLIIYDDCNGNIEINRDTWITSNKYLLLLGSAVAFGALWFMKSKMKFFYKTDRIMWKCLISMVNAFSYK